MNFLGTSYGETVGAVYANMFPDRVRAMVLDGVVDSTAWSHPQRAKNGGRFLSGGLRFRKTRRRSSTDHMRRVVLLRRRVSGFIVRKEFAMTTDLFADVRAPAGYAQDSLFPAECGGPLRLQAPPVPGLRLGPSETLAATSRFTGRWNVMFLWKGRERLYLYGTSRLASPDPHGCVEEVDPETLAPVKTSLPLPCGVHIWCGALLMHENSDLYVVNGSFMHRLDADLNILAERRLPVDRPYNGALIMADGRLLTKELRLSGEPSSFTVLHPETLEVELVLAMSEPSMGRIAAQRQADGSDHIYVPGDEHVFRYIYKRGGLTQDPSWRPRYREKDSASGRAWDTCLGDGSVWLFDNGDIPVVRQIHAAHPAGSNPPISDPNAFSTGLRLRRVSMEDDTRIDVLEPSGAPNGWVIAPPVYVPQHRVVIGYDTGNATVKAWRYLGPGSFKELWSKQVMNWWQPLVYPDSAELVMDDMTGEGDDLVVIDLLTGAEKARVATGSHWPNGMFPCPGRGRDLYYVSDPVVARVEVVERAR